EPVRPAEPVRGAELVRAAVPVEAWRALVGRPALGLDAGAERAAVLRGRAVCPGAARVPTPREVAPPTAGRGRAGVAARAVGAAGRGLAARPPAAALPPAAGPGRVRPKPNPDEVLPAAPLPPEGWGAAARPAPVGGRPAGREPGPPAHAPPVAPAYGSNWLTGSLLASGWVSGSGPSGEQSSPRVPAWPAPSARRRPVGCRRVSASHPAARRTGLPSASESVSAAEAVTSPAPASPAPSRCRRARRRGSRARRPAPGRVGGRAWPARRAPRRRRRPGPAPARGSTARGCPAAGSAG